MARALYKLGLVFSEVGWKEEAKAKLKESIEMLKHVHGAEFKHADLCEYEKAYENLV